MSCSVVIVVHPNVKGKWVDSNVQIIELLVPPLVAEVTGTHYFVHIAIFLHYNLGCI